MQRANEIIGAMLRQVQGHCEKGPIATNRQIAGTRTAGRCQCGKCKVCEDNARWARVFNEKFADPDYYSPRQVAQRSPLASL